MKRVISILLVLVMGLGLFSCLLNDGNVVMPTGTTTGGIGSSTRPTGTTTGTNTPSGTTSTTRPNGSTSGTTGTTTTTGTTGTTPTTGTTTSTTPGATRPDIPEEDPDLSVYPKDELELFNELFSYENHISLYLDISQKELQKIQKDYEKYSKMGSKSPIYRMADLHVTITKPDGTEFKYVIDQVGVRMKGNTSRTNFWDSGSGMYNLVHFKISFQETFDDAAYYGSDALTWTDTDAREARKDRTFATLEKIDMRWNKNEDNTHIRELYAYEIYREFGVLAPHTNLAAVEIGNDKAGVWMFYEPIDKIFLEKNLSPEALGGDLYKLGWTNEGAYFTSFSSYGVEDEDAAKFYVYDLKTNKKKSDHSSLKNLINTINSSSCNKDSFASVVDVDNFLMFAAVSYMIGNPDDLRNNYNNCYIYFRADNGKMMIIPYDTDRGLGVNKDWNPSGNHMTTDSPFNSTAIGNGNSNQKNPLFTKGILNNNFYKSDYEDALRTVASDDIFKISTFEEYYLRAKNLYKDDATSGKKYGNAWDFDFSFNVSKSNGSNMSYSEYITKKTQTLARYISGYSPNVGTSSNPDKGDENSGGNSGSQDVVKEWELYLRGNFNGNNWSNQTQYKFKNLGDGLYSVDVSCNDSLFKFKVYNNRQNGDVAWYNTVDESKTTVWFEYQGSNRNVQVKSGSYTVYFDTKTEMLYVVEK